MLDGSDAQRHVRLKQRVAALEDCFRQIAENRMQGVAFLHPAVRVKAIGFDWLQAEEAALGVLVTPWFMNLVLLALERQAAPVHLGKSTLHQIGGESLEFMEAYEDAASLGRFRVCSLFSPMFEFVGAAAAEDTARAVLQHLRAQSEQKRLTPTMSHEQAIQPVNAIPARRAFFLGRMASHG